MIVKKETLVKVIDEEFGDGYPFSWLIDVVIKAILKNDSKVQMATDEYEVDFGLVITTLEELYKQLIINEKVSTKAISIPHKRVKKGKSNED